MGRPRPFTASQASKRTHVGLPRASPDLGDEQVDAEGRVLVLQMALKLVDGFLQEFGALANASNDADAACPAAHVLLWSPRCQERGLPALVTAAASLGPAAMFMPK